jgi:intracellular multiplication protein IcmL
MILGPEDLDQIRAAIMPKVVRVMVLQSAAIFVLVLGLIVSFYTAATKRPEVLAVTEAGRIIPLVPLDKPYVSDARIVGFADECIRSAFGHDFLNFRTTMAIARECFTTDGGRNFDSAIAPLLKDIQERRMVMAVTLQPAIIVNSTLRSGTVKTWVVQSKMTLFREGTKDRVAPVTYIVDLVVERVPLEDSVRGISVSQINVRPGSAV